METGPKYYSGRDLGDETESGEEIMYRLKLQEAERLAELARQAGMDDTFDDSQPVNNYPQEINERGRELSG